MIERDNEIVIKKESDILETIEGEDKFWKIASKESMRKMWSKEDDVWDKTGRKTLQHNNK